MTAIGLSDTVSVANFPAVQRVTGSVSIDNASFSGTIVVTGVVFPTPIIVTSTGSLGVAVQNFPALQQVSGSVGISNVVPTIVQSLPNVTGSVNVTNALFRVTGSVGVDGITFPETITTTGSHAVINQVTVTLTSSLPVSGTVNLDRGNSAGVPLFIQGSISTTPPLVTAVTGSQVTGSTFTDRPVVVGAVDASGVVRALRVGQNGEVSVFTTGSLPVTVGNQIAVTSTGSLPVVLSGTAQVTGSVGITTQVNVSVTSSLPVTVTSQIGISNFPASQNVNGAVSVYTQGAQLISGTVSVFTSAPQGITGSVAVYTQGPQAVSGTVSIGNWPVTIGVSGSTTLKVWDPGTVSVSGSQLTGSTAAGFPVIVGGVDGGGYVKGLKTDVSGALSVFVSSSLPVTGAIAVVNQVTITVTSSLPVTFSGQTQVTGTVNLDRGNTALVPLFIQGSISTTPPLVTAVTGSQLTGSTFTDRPVVVGGVDASGIVRGIRTGQNGEVSVFTTGSLPVTVGNQIAVTLTSSLPVTFAGAVTVLGSVSTFTQGAQLVSGTLGINNFPATQNVSGSVSVFTQGPQAVSGTVSIGNWPVTIGVSGSTTLKVWDPGTMSVSGSQLTGSTAAGFPVIVGGADGAGYVRGLKTDVSGALSIFVSSSLPITGTLAVTNQVTVTVTSSLPVTFSGQAQVTGTVNLDRGNTALVPLFIQGSISTTPPLVTAVTGSQLTGSTFTDRPVVIGAIDAAGIVRGVRVGQNGEVSIMATGSLPVTVGNFPALTTVNGSVSTYTQGPQAVTGSVSVFTQGPQQVSGTVGVNNFPAVQAVSGSQLTGSTFVGSPVVVGGVDASGVVRGIRTGINGEVSVFTTGSLPVTVGNFPATQTVIGSVGTFTQGAQLVSGTISIGNWPPTIGVSSSFALRVFDTGTTAVTGSVAVYTQGAQQVSGTVGVFTSAPQGVTGSVSVYTQGAQLVSGTVSTLTGRTIKMFCTSSVTGTMGETLITLQALSNYAVSGATGTSFVPTNGKTLRCQAMVLTWNTVTAISGSVICRFRVSSSGAVTAKSPSILSIGAMAGGGGPTAAGANLSQTSMVSFPDGIEFTGTQQFGITQQASVAAPSFDISLIAFEY